MPVVQFIPPRRFDNAAEWLRALGNVPPERIIFDPWPGTATEADLLRLVERDKRLCELIDGTLVEEPVGFWHSLIGMNLMGRLGTYVDARGLGIVAGANATLRMPSCGRIRLPDGVFISRERQPTLLEPVPCVAPDLAGGSPQRYQYGRRNASKATGILRIRNPPGVVYRTGSPNGRGLPRRRRSDAGPT
jgi:hypothetical protein